MRNLIFGLVFMCGSVAFAAEDTVTGTTMNMNYAKGEEITKILEDYSKATGKRIVIDYAVRGRVTILNSTPVSTDEAFNMISTALALNGVSINDEEGTLVVRQSRSAQRALIPVVTELPALKPERMVTWIVTLKNLPADEVMKQVRTLNSKDGESVALVDTNQLMFSDYTSSLHRISKVIAELDKPIDSARAKIVASAKKMRDQERAMRAKNPVPSNPPAGFLPNSGASEIKPTPKSQSGTGQ